jgi:hypothetical protein
MIDFDDGISLISEHGNFSGGEWQQNGLKKHTRNEWRSLNFHKVLQAQLHVLTGQRCLNITGHQRSIGQGQLKKQQKYF